MRILFVVFMLLACGCTTETPNQLIRLIGSEIQLKSNGELLVTESIEFDRASEAQYGILRQIPRMNMHGKPVTVDVIEALLDGQPAIIDQEQRGPMHFIVLRLADAQLKPGRHQLHAIYKVTGLPVLESNWYKFRWVPGGMYWKLPTRKVNVVFSPPQHVQEEHVRLETIVCEFDPAIEKPWEESCDGIDQVKFLKKFELDSLQPDKLRLGVTTQGILPPKTGAMLSFAIPAGFIHTQSE